MSAPSTGLAVVHLVRRANGMAPFESFIESYRRHPAGTPHALVFVFKGFDNEASTEPYRRLASELSPRCLLVADDGFDLGSYRRAARELEFRRVLFLNSFSVVLVDDWLALLAASACERRVAAVAASGSWGSLASHVLYDEGFGGAYASIFPDRHTVYRVFEELAGDAPSPPLSARARPPSLARVVALRARSAARVAREAVRFPQFPTPHLRTNGLLIERERWLAVCRRSPRDKLDAHRMESGRRGITARLGVRGLAVVGRDGRSYRSNEWPASHTFWQGNQENLLIGDNQTRAYQEGDACRRQVLSGYAWGHYAAPYPEP